MHFTPPVPQAMARGESIVMSNVFGFAPLSRSNYKESNFEVLLGRTLDYQMDCKNSFVLTSRHITPRHNYVKLSYSKL
jgi:penicillin V acylase-like amidase (Ntn superfamily)